ncbi:MAG: CDP-diacylglycerol--serine O-phosphatidyltransferase [Alphaproteobacteria bacterium]
MTGEALQNNPSERPKPGMLLTRLIPNVLTLFSLCSGLSAIRFALMERWESAVAAIIVASIFDMLDGRVARMLNLTSRFGAELDSLSDMISFGVAPAITLYLWAMHGGDEIGWLAVLAYVICAALRLARFNTMLEDTNLPSWRKGYFVGLASPAAAGLAMLPMYWSFAFDVDYFKIPELIALWLMLLGGLMVSRLPTFAIKGHRVPRTWVVPILVALTLMAAQLVTNPWRTFGLIGIIYSISLPISWYKFRQRSRLEETL